MVGQDIGGSSVIQVQVGQSTLLLDNYLIVIVMHSTMHRMSDNYYMYVVFTVYIHVRT